MASQFGPELLRVKAKEKTGSLSRRGFPKIKQMDYNEEVELFKIKGKRGHGYEVAEKRNLQVRVASYRGGQTIMCKHAYY